MTTILCHVIDPEVFPDRDYSTSKDGGCEAKIQKQVQEEGSKSFTRRYAGETVRVCPASSACWARIYPSPMICRNLQLKGRATESDDGARVMQQAFPPLVLLQ